MKAAWTIKVFPIYGWGWVIEGSPSSEIPQPFTIQLEQAEAARWAGVVLDTGHEFEGQRVDLSPRHVSWTGTVNVKIQPLDPAGKDSSGFATVAGLPPAETA